MKESYEFKIVYYDHGVQAAISECTFANRKEAEAYAEHDLSRLEKRIVMRMVTDWKVCVVEKLMPCPFCGDECACGDGYVECLNDSCCYSSGDRGRSDAEAIAAHNRVCKAVKAYDS